jgi:hypothetical protein
MHKVLSVAFIIKTRPGSIGFKFPEEIRVLLRVAENGPLALVVRKTSGELIYCGISKLTSKGELTDINIFRNLENEAEIMVTASFPPSIY